MPVWSRAMNSVEASDFTISSRTSRDGGGLERESWGVSRANASMISSLISVAMETSTVLSLMAPRYCLGAGGGADHGASWR